MVTVGSYKHFQKYLVILALLLLFTQASLAQTSPSFTSTPVTTGVYNDPYTYNITTSDAEDSPREIVITSGVLPDGLNLLDNGDGTASISGTANEVGAFPIELTVREVLLPLLFFDTQSFTIDVSKATPIITWANPADITYGTALSGTQLNATASVAGSFTYLPPGGTVLGAGVNQTLTVDFTPTDGTNYNAVNGLTSQITVNKATPVITWPDPADITYGTALSGTQLNATASVAGTFTYLPPAGMVLNAGVNQTLTVNFTPTDGSNYNAVNGSTAQITVNKAMPVITWSDPAAITFGTPLSGTQLNATADVAGTFTYLPPAATVLAAGVNRVLTMNFAPTDGANYNPVNGTTVHINVNKATPVVTWADPADIIYGTALNGTQLNAVADVPGTFTYLPPVGTVLNTGANQSLTVNFTPTDGANYNAVNGQTAHITVNKATPVITWLNPAAITYGTALSATQLNATAGVAGAFTYIPSAGTVLSVGVNQTLTANFVPTDVANYNVVNGTTVQITVNKATPVITWTNPSPITFGTPLGATELNATANVGGTFAYSPPGGTVLNAGASQILSVNFTPTDGANYNVVNGTTVLITVNKATPVITWTTPAAITYGTPLSATQLNASPSTPGTFVYVPASGTVLNAGASQMLTANFTPTDVANYNVVNGTTVQIAVNKATPVITWSAPADITYGTALSALQLNATSSVPGTLTYVPPIGTLLGAGVNQTLTVNFTPTDGTNYNVVNGTTVPITVNKATPAITWTNPTAITYGTALGVAQLNAGSSVPGSFAYVPPAGTILGAGTGQNLSVNFTPTDGANYNVVNGTTVQITVNKATPVVTWAPPAAITYGTALSGTQLNATSTVAGSFSYAPGIGTVLNAGTNQALSVNFTPADAANYNAVNGTQVFITVNAATPVITWAPPAAIDYGTPLGPTQLNATANVPGTFTYSPPSGTVLSAGVNQTLSVNFAPAAPGNYNAVNGTTVQITVNKATPVITWPNPAAITYGTALSAVQLNATTTILGTFTYMPTTGTVMNAGVSQTLSVNFIPTDGANYNQVLNTQRQLTVNKATPIITWPNPAPITYGTLLSATQLNASANVPGTFTYAPPAGTLLNTGVNQTLSANFTPNDAVNYNVVNGTTALITVNKATPVITWPPPLPIKVGVALSSTQLNASANVPGTFVYTPPIGTMLPAGNNQILSVDFTPTDAANYNVVNNTQVTITVSVKDNPLITWGPPAAITYGTPLSAAQLNATADVPGTFSYTPPIGTILSAGSQTLSMDFVPTDGVNYNSVHTTNPLTVNKATLTATAPNTSRIYGTPNPVFIINYTGFVNSETLAVIDTAPIAMSSALTGSPAGSTFPIVPVGGVDNNYSFNYVNGILTINKAPLTARADDKSRSYGLANPTFTISYTGFVNGDDNGDITVPAIGTSATTASNVGTYPITLTGGSASNYTITLQNGTLAINISALTVRADDKSKTYSQANPPLTISYSGFLNGDSPSSITPPSISTTAVTSSDAGTYPITLTGGSATNYGLILQNGTLTIAKAALTAKADDKSKIYGQANPPLTITYTGFVNGDGPADITAPTIATTASTGTNAGSYPITLSGGSSSNYTLTLQNGTLTISKATPIVTWVNQAPITYGTPLSSTQLSAIATVPGTFIYTPPVGTILNAGPNQTLSVNFTPADITNYNLVNGTTVLITVNKATPTITWPNPAAITYGTALGGTQLNATSSTTGTFVYSPPSGTVLNAGANQVLSVNFSPTDAANYVAVNGTTVLITVNKATPVITWSNPAPITFGTAITSTQLNATSNVPGTFTYSPVSGTILNAGPNQTLSVNFLPTNGANYNAVNGTTVQITVNKATPVITWANPAPITYGTALSATQLNASVGITGVFSYAPGIGTVLGAGPNQPLLVNFTPTDGANYNAVNNTQVLITVNKATPVITWSNPASITYGTALSATQLNASASVPGAFTYTPPAGTILNTGVNQTLSLNFNPTDASNYNVVNGVTRQITVTKATPVVSWPPPLPIKVNVPLNGTQLNATASVPGTFTYAPPGGTTFGTAGTYTLSVNFAPTDAANYNVVNNTQVQIIVSNKDNPVITWTNPADITYGVALGTAQLNATSSVPGTFSYSPPSGTVLSAGTNQLLTATFTPTDGINFNQVISTVHINVSKASLTATASGTSRTYGGSNPLFTIVYTGFVNGDSPGVIDTAPTSTCSAIASSPAGNTFAIVPAGGVDNNYTFTYVNGALFINKALLTAKADDKSRSYGLANPTFTISYSGFVNGDNPSDISSPTGSTTATLASNVGSYPITLSGGASSNYDFVFQTGTLTVNVSPLTARADNKAKIYGQANPPLTITYSGFLNSDSPSSITEPTISTTATVLTGVGTFSITLSGGSAQNYGLILQPGTMTIGKATLTAKADDKSKTYGQANPPNTISYTGFVNGDNAASITPPAIAGPAATAASSVGTYPITLSGGTSANYNLTLQNGALTINKAPLRINVQDKSRMYSQQNPVLTFTYVTADFVNGDNALTITAPVATTTATTASPAGTYPITVTGTTLNYNFVVTNGTLTVTKALLTARADDKSKTYGDPTPSLTISYSGFVNGESLAEVTTTPTPATTATSFSDAGSYPITVSGGVAANYDFNYVPGTLLVNKKVLIATAKSQSRLFESPNPPLTITYSGFVSGETAAVIDTPPVASTNATTGSPVGSYSITLSSGQDVNYDFTYVSGILSVISSFAPAISNFQIDTNEDLDFVFNYETFNQHFLGYPGDSIVSLKIVQPPINGNLFWLGKKIVAGDQISILHGNLNDFIYSPAENFNGPDAVIWNAFDGTFSASTDAVMSINVVPVNDPPILDNIEPEPILYSLGDAPVSVTKTILVSDIDNGFMSGAKIALIENYKNGDLLSLAGATSANITSTFDPVKGELVLTGNDSKSNYEAALHNILFSSPISGDTALSVKKVALSVNDGVDTSNLRTRTIQITKVFPELSMVNAFTPNNDGVNDYWDFVNLQFYTEIKIVVYDQNGVRVFECNSKNCKWDGKIKGKDLPAGPYLYGIDLDNGKRTYKGTVTILK